MSVKTRNGIELFRDYFQRQESVTLSSAEQAIMTHLIWVMNEHFSEEVQITLRQLAARCNVDVRTIKAKLPQLCSKNYLMYAEINGEVCSVAYKNVEKNKAVSNFSAPNKLINKYNIIKGDFQNEVSGNAERISLADL